MGCEGLFVGIPLSQEPERRSSAPILSERDIGKKATKGRVVFLSERDIHIRATKGRVVFLSERDIDKRATKARVLILSERDIVKKRKMPGVQTPALSSVKSVTSSLSCCRNTAVCCKMEAIRNSYGSGASVPHENRRY
jgi:hypothetical protein